MSEKKTNIYLQRLNSFSKEVDYKYNCISLFSGGGGLDLGAHFAGFKTLLVSDIIPTYTETIKANLPHVSVYNDDAMDLTAEKIRSLANIKGDIDLIIAGPPCQAFSIMGKRQSLDDPRGKLTIKYFELVSGLRPKVFMFENVPGLMTVNHGEDFTNLLEFIENKTGYQLYRTKLNASDFGIPQERERIFIVGFRPDMVIIDYFECLAPEKIQYSKADTWEKEGITIRKLEKMTNKYNIAIWIPVQGNRESIGLDKVGLAQGGGSIKKTQAAHVVITFAQTDDQKTQGRMNIFLAKLRSGKITRNQFYNVAFNNGTCKFDMSNIDADTSAIENANDMERDMEIAAAKARAEAKNMLPK